MFGPKFDVRTLTVEQLERLADSLKLLAEEKRALASYKSQQRVYEESVACSLQAVGMLEGDITDGLYQHEDRQKIINATQYPNE